MVRAMNYIASIFCTFIICHSPQKSSFAQKVYRAGLAAEGRPVLVQPLRRCAPAPLVGEPLAKPFTLRGLPKPPLQGATATTTASGGNREELLGPRPAGCERQRSRRWKPQPGQWHGVSRDGEVGRRGSLPYPPGTSSLLASSRRAVVSGRSLAASIWPGETW